MLLHCSFPTIGAHECWSQLLKERDEGILFASGMKRTRLMAELKQNLAEGKQAAKTNKERWQTFEQRKAII